MTLVLPATNMHAMTNACANAAIAHLAAEGIPVAVELGDVVHLYPLHVLTTGQEVEALRTFAAVTDYRLAWHDPVGTP